MVTDTMIRLVFAMLIAAHALARFIWRIYLYQQTQQRKEKSNRKILSVGEISVFIAMRLWALSAMMYPFNFTWFDFPAPLPSWIRWLGVVGMILCLAPSVWTFVSLGRSFSPGLRMRTGHQLITTGPYQLVRHPMYATFFLCALSATLASANLVITFTTMVAITALALRIKKEDEMLLKHFGERYIEYMRKTGAIVPKWFLSR